MVRLIGLTLAVLLGGCTTLGLPPVGPVGRAEQLLEEGRATEAAATARQVPPTSPDYARARALVARADALRDRLASQALARGPALEASGDLLEAVRLYEAALLADPGHASIRQRLEAAREALALERQRRRFAAERAEGEGLLAAGRAWKAVAEVEPADREVQRKLAELEAKRPTLAAVHLARARKLREGGRLEEALAEADLAARLDPARADARALAIRLEEEATAAAAAPIVPAAAGEAKENAGAGEAAGKSKAAKSGPKPEAKKAGKPAAGEPGGGAKAGRAERRAAPRGASAESADAIVREAIAIARSAVGKGDYLRALRALARAEAEVPGSDELAVERERIQRLVDAEVEERINRGISRFQLEDLRGAIEEWQRALELDPDNAVALDYRKKAEGMLKRIEEIREETRRQGELPASGP